MRFCLERTKATLFMCISMRRFYLLTSEVHFMQQSINKIFSLSVTANRPLTIEELRDSISSELEGNPPLWITRTPGKYGVDVYINNAKILLEQSNFQSKLKVNGDTMIQVNEKWQKFIIFLSQYFTLFWYYSYLYLSIYREMFNNYS